MNILKKTAIIITILLISSAATLWFFKDQIREENFNFSTVESGKLYRSGMPSKSDINYMKDKYKIKSIFSFSGDVTQPYEDLTQMASNLNIRLFKLPMGNKVSPKKAFLELFLAEMADSNNCPALVHCGAGADRTGWVIMTYRSLYDDWTFKQALREAKEDGLDYDDPTKKAITQNLEHLITHLIFTNIPVASIQATVTIN